MNDTLLRAGAKLAAAAQRHSGIARIAMESTALILLGLPSFSDREPAKREAPALKPYSSPRFIADYSSDRISPI